jgi:hypothetical protein
VTVSHHITDRKVIIRLTRRLCETPDELLASEAFADVVSRCVADLARRHSILLHIFENEEITPSDIACLIHTLQFLAKIPADLVPNLVPGSRRLLADRQRFGEFVEHLYNFWRSYDRFIVCDSIGDELDKRPYRTFNATVEQLTHLVRATYRDIQENVTGVHPRIYRQVRAGAGMAAIGMPHDLPYPASSYRQLNRISLIRQVLLNPPVILYPPMNKRRGEFKRVTVNPLDLVSLRPEEWLGYPALVGPLLVAIYFHENFFELGFSLSNLFELADDNDLTRKPDAVYLFGVPGNTLDSLDPLPTVFYDDEEHDLLVGAVPNRHEFGYFGYLKKMVLTLHNIKMMKKGMLPFHGAFVRIVMRDDRAANLLLIGDTGTGKSETLEAFRLLGEDAVQDMIVIADDMGSLDIAADGRLVGYGTETGAFVRLDDLQPGYVFGQIDRSIIMSPGQVNTRVVLPVTTHAEVIRGHPVDFILYANNYQPVDEDHPILERFSAPEQALSVFRAGAAMSKGTTTATGLTHAYFANIFGPAQYPALHDQLAGRFFEAFFRHGLFVGQLRTRLGLPGWEMTGPQASAQELLKVLSVWCHDHPVQCH